jgi:hypothetical protein
MGAIIDPTGTYRYRLWRQWDRTQPRVAFVMLNPSTADAVTDDPTIRRCIRLAQSWGYGSVEVVNLFAYRATQPAVLRRVADPIGPKNDRYLLQTRRRARTIIAAWGNHGLLGGRGRVVLRLLGNEAGWHCLGMTKHGQPRHPLYVRRDAVPLALALRAYESARS